MFGHAKQGASCADTKASCGPTIRRTRSRSQLPLADVPRNRLLYQGFRPYPEGTGSFSVEAQQQGEAELRRPTLAGHQVQLVAHQRPTVDQFILVQLPSDARSYTLNEAIVIGLRLVT